MSTHLMRTVLRPLHETARDGNNLDAHPGLLLQRGLPEHDDGDQKAKAEHIECICRAAATDFYRRAYDRWKNATADETRFRSVFLRVETRLFIGLNGGGMLETGCLVSRSYGTPYIPGSSVKGLVVSHVRDRFGDTGGALREYRDELLGAPVADNGSAGRSGLIAFHDAWWVPDSTRYPLVQEVVTTHHPDYYGTDGAAPATDCDSPIPNVQVAVHGDFLFVIEGPAGWLDTAEQMLVAALTGRGVGARTRAGYGQLATPESGGTPQSRRSSDPSPAWVDGKIAELSARPGVQPDQALRGKALAEAWSRLEEPALKRAALADIRARWEDRGWWSEPQGGSARKAKAIYDAHGVQVDETS